ncbi:hypothetical protein RJT34_00841 [Clitoria ternatea]|uniref:Alginate lyase 2 domain-containing protein n=1 Tax=Clitoria ternatea TaxID=43366 RepID=A0AAN9Q0A1_CLITE
MIVVNHLQPTTMVPLPILVLTLLPLIIHPSYADSTQGFTPVPLGSSNFVVQKPYNVSVDKRYSFTNGVHKFWVYSTDKPHQPSSNTEPRTEIRVVGYDYTSGIWQFEGHAGTSGVCIMQVFGGSSWSTTSQLRVYGGSLAHYTTTIEPNIYNRWFKVNVIHDANANTVKVYINDGLKFNGAGRGKGTHYFKFGVYKQDGASNYMESRWRDIKIFRK